MTLVVAGYPGEIQKVEFAKMMRFTLFHHIEGLSLQPSGVARGVEVTFTRAVAPGILVEQTVPMVVNANANGSGDPRRDRIILKHDWGTNTSTLEVKHGTPATNPQLPSVTLNPGVLFEQTLAHLFTADGQGAYQQGDILSRANPTQSPVCVVPFAQFDPDPAERIVRIDPDTGHMRYGDGVNDLPLKIRAGDIIDRAFMNLEGAGNDRHPGPGEETFRTTWITHHQVGFTGGSNSSERVIPFDGFYYITQHARCTGNANADEEFQLLLRNGGTPGQLDGSIISRAAGNFNTQSTPEAFCLQGEITGPWNAGDILKFTLRNSAGGAITDDGNADWKYGGGFYLGPA